MSLMPDAPLNIDKSIMASHAAAHAGLSTTGPPTWRRYGLSCAQPPGSRWLRVFATSRAITSAMVVAEQGLETEFMDCCVTVADILTTLLPAKIAIRCWLH